MPSFELRDGELVEVPDDIIAESGVFDRNIARTLQIASGVQVTTTGKISGTVNVGEGVDWIAVGDVSGTVTIAAGATVTFQRQASGTIHIQKGATVTLGPACVALGAITVDGLLVNGGTRGVHVRGSGTVDDLPGSRVRQPDEVRADGTTVYYG